MNTEQIKPPTGFCQCGCGGRTAPAKCTDKRHGLVAGEPLRYLPNHHHRKGKQDFLVDEAGCWVWQRGMATNGYGQCGRQGLAHRVYYQRLVGPIPHGLVIDHLCSNRACVNPDHLELVTLAENTRRADHTGPKLTIEQVREIRRLTAEGATQVALADRFSVSPKTILDIRRGHTWSGKR